MGSLTLKSCLICIIMSDIKLSYSNGRGRAETSRLILAHAGVRYTDQRLSGEQFSNVKPKLPYGQLPVVKVDGEVICQSITIARYLANQFGLGGRTNIEKAQADEIADVVNDLIDKRIAAMRETDENKKSTLTKEFMSETIPETLGKLETRLVERGGQFFAGNNLTWADLHVFAFVDRMRLGNTELLDDYPKMKNLIERIEQEPNIANWLQSRPNTMM